MDESLTNRINVIRSIYVRAAGEATKKLLKGWLILPGAVMLYLIFELAAIVCAPLGHSGGLLLGIVEILLLTAYYSWLSEVASGNRFRFSDFKEINWELFSGLISVGFILSIALFIVQTLVKGTEGEAILPFIRLAMVIIFNSVPEMIYIHGYQSLLALERSAKFTLDYWLVWFPTTIVLALPLLLISFEMFLYAFLGSEPLMPGLFLVLAWRVGAIFFGYILILLGLILANWFMLFRAALFQDLERGGLRRRLSY